MRRWTSLAAVMLILTAGSVAAEPIDGKAVLGGALGGAAGTALGSAVGGREGAILGGALGAGVGAAVGSSQSSYGRPAHNSSRPAAWQNEHDSPPFGRAWGHRKRKHH